jgi:hypothetical protein
VSTKTEENIPELRVRIEDLMFELKNLLVEKGAVVAEFEEK